MLYIGSFGIIDKALPSLVIAAECPEKLVELYDHGINIILCQDKLEKKYCGYIVFKWLKHILCSLWISILYDAGSLNINWFP